VPFQEQDNSSRESAQAHEREPEQLSSMRAEQMQQAGRRDKRAHTRSRCEKSEKCTSVSSFVRLSTRTNNIYPEYTKLCSTPKKSAISFFAFPGIDVIKKVK
jgi:hypothetical protein